MAATATLEPIESMMPLDDDLSDLVAFAEDVAAELVPTPDQHVDNGARDAVHAELGAKLSSVRGDEVQERAAFASAIDAFMRIHLDRGAPTHTAPSDVLCPEFFWEGDTHNPPVYGRVPDATNDEIGRWFKLLVEEARAYQERVAPSA